MSRERTSWRTSRVAHVRASHRPTVTRENVCIFLHVRAERQAD